MGPKPSSFNSRSSRQWREVACAAGLACLLPTCEEAAPVRVSALDAERYGAGLCSARLECCEDAPSQDCAEAHAQKLLLANRDDVVIDEACLSTVVSLAETLECRPRADFVWDNCLLATGHGVPGNECELWGDHGYYAHTCAPRYTCHWTTFRCVENFTIEGLGGLTGDRCDEYLRCEIGYYCDATGRCAEKHGEGETCTDKIGCKSNLFCGGLDADSSGICQVAGALGDACDEQDYHTCERNQNENDVFVQLECVEGRCQEPGPYACEDIG